MKDATAPRAVLQGTAAILGAGALRDDPEVTPVALGNQPAWPRDGVAVSARVRAMLAGLRPVVVRVLAFWDHAVRSVALGTRRLEIDPSGSYRLR